MRFFFKRVDGGPQSNVTGFWLCEGKRSFSIALLRFTHGRREAYHSHAFNCLSWILKGCLQEDRMYIGRGYFNHEISYFKRSLKPVVTTRDNLHRVTSIGTTWAFTIRGPWTDKWYEVQRDYLRYLDILVTFTHGRKIIKKEVLNEHG